MVFQDRFDSLASGEASHCPNAVPHGPMVRGIQQFGSREFCRVCVRYPGIFLNVLHKFNQILLINLTVGKHRYVSCHPVCQKNYKILAMHGYTLCSYIILTLFFERREVQLVFAVVGAFSAPILISGISEKHKDRKQ